MAGEQADQRRASEPSVAELVADGTLPVQRLEKLLDHQMTLERRQQNLEWAGLISALIIALSFLAVSAGLIAAGHEVGGTVMGTVDLVALVSVFVVGRRT